MHFRRFILAVTAPVLATLAGAAQAQTISADDAKAFVAQASGQMVSIVNSSESQTQKSADLRTLVNQVVAVDQVGDYVLGRYINVATPDQHQQFQTLFHQLLAYNITFEIKAYEGVGITVNSAAPQGNDMVVDTTVTTPGKAPADVGWAVDEIGGKPQIVDVIVAGTSMRISTRDDYSSVITDNGGDVSALLAAMNKQINRIASQQ
jgi:phospholipid transport system substrate-binding protein